MEIKKLYSLFLTNGQKITTDSRKIEKGQIFFALKGDNFDGNKYALKAIKAGASYAVVDDILLEGKSKIIFVQDVLTTLQELALHHRRTINIPIIAITGSNGKTTSKELIKDVLAKKFKVAYTKGNLNNHIGIPLTLLDIKVYEDIAIVEMGANHQGEIASYCLYTEPNFGLITNIGKAHLEGFGGIEGVIKGKTELYSYIKKYNGNVFINSDDIILSEKAENLNQIPYGTNSKLEINGNIIDNSTKFLQIKINDDIDEYSIQTQLTGDYNLYNVLAAYTIGRYFEISPELCKSAIESYTPTNSRSQLIKKPKHTILLDAYNANPSSMEVALINLSKQVGRKIAIIGAMKELGDYSALEHRKILEKALELNINEIIAVGEEYIQEDKNDCKSELQFSTSDPTTTTAPITSISNTPIMDKVIYLSTTEQAKKWYKTQVWDGEVILIKGSRGMTLEKILD
jgi:UDP-N-acetylmuramoyl-tripeptide--D-alanyl-D-alanine ligase